MYNNNLKSYLLVFLLLIETLCVTYALKFPSLISIATLLYFLSGITIAFIVTRIPSKKITLIQYVQGVKLNLYFKVLIIIILGFIIRYFTLIWITGTPLSYYDADMLPIIKVMSQRFLDGQWSMVYKPIPEIWNGIQPIYLPAMWAPYMIALAGHFDVRWITAAALMISLSLIILSWRSSAKQFMDAAIFAAISILCWWLLTEKTNNFIRLSEEGVVVFYYCLLVLSLFSQNVYFISFTAAFCALSRYMLAGWYPAMILYYLLIQKKPKQLAIFIGCTMLVFLIMVVIPFGWEPFQIAIQLPHQYIVQAERIWKESPQYFLRSMGFAKFFGSDRIKLLHTILLIAGFLTPLLFIVICYDRGKLKRKNLTNIPLACLKITIVTVCTFIDIPYQYLFYTSSFISLLMVVLVLSTYEKVPG